VNSMNSYEIVGYFYTFVITNVRIILLMSLISVQFMVNDGII